MNILIISVGRERADPVAPLVSDYNGRIRKFLPLEERVLRADKQDTITREMLKTAKPGGITIALDERGKEYSSREFRALVEQWMNQGKTQLAFLIGPADGLPRTVTQKADMMMALSRMTLPHRFARLLLAEQIYRALATIRGIPYHK